MSQNRIKISEINSILSNEIAYPWSFSEFNLLISNGILYF
jgi:hypothetical protein